MEDATCPHCNVNTADRPDAIRFYPDGQRECVLCGSRWQAHVRPSTAAPGKPTRIVIEMDDCGPVAVRAERPDEVVVIIHHISPRLGTDPSLIYGGTEGLPIERLAVVSSPGPGGKLESVGADWAAGGIWAEEQDA